MALNNTAPREGSGTGRWRKLAALFDEAFQRERQRRRIYLMIAAVVVATLVVTLNAVRSDGTTYSVVGVGNAHLSGTLQFIQPVTSHRLPAAGSIELTGTRNYKFSVGSTGNFQVRIAPGTYRLLAQDPARVAGGKLTCSVRDARIHDASGGSHIQRFPSKLTVPANGAMSLGIGCFNSVG
jgi:hypothetical protein